LDIDGIEILNFEYDGFFPCPTALKLFEELKQKNKNVFGIFGLDIHRKIHFRNIFVEVDCRIREKEIIGKLKGREFLNRTTLIRITSRNNFHNLQILCFLFHHLFSLLKKTGILVLKVIRKMRNLLW
jgi:hypothetical protein